MTTPVSPFVRARIRTARGLDPQAVLVCTPTGATWSGWPLTEDQLPSALGLAAAVAVTDPTALEPALSWAAPVVTTPELAAGIGAVAGRDVLVADDPIGAVQHVLDDDHLAARLSRAGRALHTSRYGGQPPPLPDPLLDPLPSPRARLDAQLDALGTPPGAFVIERVAAALRPFTEITQEDPMLPEPLRQPAAGELEPTAVPPVLPGAARTPRTVARSVARRLRAALAAFRNPDAVVR